MVRDTRVTGGSLRSFVSSSRRFLRVRCGVDDVTWTHEDNETFESQNLTLRSDGRWYDSGSVNRRSLSFVRGIPDLGGELLRN